jgi:hypothetical protein
VAIRATRLERDTASLLRDALQALVAGESEAASAATIDEIVSAATAALDGETGTPLWSLADRIARLRAADPEQVSLLAELLDVLVARTEKRRAAGSSGTRSGGYRLPPA